MATRKRATSGPNLEDIKYPKTDHTRWRLRDDNGRQTWHYLQTDEEIKQWPLTTADKHHLGLDTVGEPLSCQSMYAKLSGISTSTQSKDCFAGGREWPQILL